MALNAKKYLHSDELNEWDTVFDPGGKQEYTEEQLIRFAEMWAEIKLNEKIMGNCECGKTEDPAGKCDGSHEIKSTYVKIKESICKAICKITFQKVRLGWCKTSCC